jgi:hypothetical protein
MRTRRRVDGPRWRRGQKLDKEAAPTIDCSQGATSSLSLNLAGATPAVPGAVPVVGRRAKSFLHPYYSQLYRSITIFAQSAFDIYQ